MGITVGHLLSQDYFKDFVVVAGQNGLNREVQGVTVWDCPDCFKWTLGKELVITNGYAIINEADYSKYLTPEMVRSSAALVIKRGRYLDTVPQKLLDLYNSQNVPILIAPYSVPYMELINQVNVAVMNEAIAQLSANLNIKFTTSNRNYKIQKIQQLLRTVEQEMSFPAAIYDVFEEKAYYSSQNFIKTSEKYGLRMEDYWNPGLAHTRHTLCDCIHMMRYRLLNGEAANEPRISWVTIPILVDHVPQAYFCVMESRRFMDFYDEYFMRFAFMVLRGVYEQIAVASNIGFENLIHMALENREENFNKLSDQANQLGIRLDRSCFCVMFRHNHSTYDIRSRRSEMVEIFRQCAVDRCGRIALISREEGIIVINPDKVSSDTKETLISLIEEYHSKLSRKFERVEWTFSFSMEKKDLTHISEAVTKCRKIMHIDHVACPDAAILDYDKVGILTWLDIPDEELYQLMEPLMELKQEGKNKDLLQTLRVYLECNMNYSLTAEKLFVNINTIRRRIEKINEIMAIDWDNYMERIKIGLLVQFMQ